MRLIIFGSPGVGKGTQAKIISEKLNIAHISTGDLLREAIVNQTENGLKAKEYMDRGELVPDEIVGEIVRDTLKDPKCKNGFIFDGFPRTLNQAEILDKILHEFPDEQLHLIKLDAEEDVIIKRLSCRRVCRECGYLTKLERIENRKDCPNCGAENSFFKRDDDGEDVIKNRLKIYYKTTEPVLNFYTDKATIYNISGIGDKDEISKNILENLGITE